MKKLKRLQNTFFGYDNKSKSKISIIFEIFGYKDLAFFITSKRFEGPSAKSIFFFSVLCGKAEKQQNTVFGYKKGSKSKINIIFEIFAR